MEVVAERVFAVEGRSREVRACMVQLMLAGSGLTVVDGTGLEVCCEERTKPCRISS